MALKTFINIDIKGVQSPTAPAGGGVEGLLKKIQILTDGTGNTQADLMYSAQRTLAASANELLDLAGVLTDPLGNTLTFVEVILVGFQMTNTTAGDAIIVGPDSSAGWGDSATGLGPWADASDRSGIAAEGFFLWYNPRGLAVGAGTSDEIYVEEVGTANSAVYNVLVIGRSA